MTQPERILELFQKHPNKPHSLREILRSLRLDKPEAKEALELLVAEGKLTETKRRLYQLPEAKARKGFEARLQAHPSGFAFAIPIEAELPDLFIPKGYLGGAWHGDRIRAEAKPPGRDRRPWGAVTAVLERAHHHLIGRLFFRKGYALLHPDDPRLPDLKLRPEGLEGLEAGARILVRVQYPQGRKAPAEPYGEFQTFLGQEDTPEVETEAIIAKYELLPEFSLEALEQAEKVAQGGAELEGRSDFRSLRVFTIDGPDAKDFDDAIHVTKLENGNFQVGIHIADVSHYVEEFTPLDQEAYARATSVYLPGRVLPMLPERLSNGVCSLKPGEDRLVLSVLAELTPKGRVKRYTFHRGVIRSLARLTYPQVEALAQAREKGAGEAEALSSLDLPGSARAALEADLATLLDLTQTLKKRRLEEGALDFHFTEVKVEVGEEGELHLIPQQEPRARSLIEELMLLANRIVARHLAERGIPALFRVHEDPSEEALGKLVAALEKLGYRLGGGEPSPKALQAILNQAEGRPEAPAVSTLLLRSLRLARYAAENLGHFGLAAEHYLHFTSPIRRYPDLVVHRVLKTLLRGRISERHKADWGSRFPKIAEHTSERERAAEAAERELTKYYQCRWAEARLGQRFPGVVSGVTQFGVFVTIAGGVEGMIRLGALEDDQYHYYEELLALEGVRTKRRIRIGDALEVQIQAANPAARQIDLVPTEKFYEEQPMDEQRSDRKRRTPPSGRAKAHSSKSEPKARGREAARPHKASRVVGPPDKKREFDKPVRATARKIYFGAWEPEAGEAPQDPARATPKASSRRRRGRGRRS